MRHTCKPLRQVNGVGGEGKHIEYRPRCEVVAVHDNPVFRPLPALGSALRAALVFLPIALPTDT
jgi:hypothetical protein